MNTNEWQPIETAPKDGTEILGFDLAKIEVNILKWISKEDYISKSKEIGTANWKFPVEGWVNNIYDSTYHTPTHWMPLPKPPQK